MANMNRTHGMSKTKLYQVWAQMIARCVNPKTPCFNNYGGRGVKVCDRWLHSFEAFFNDMGPQPGPHHEIDRHPDNNGNYEPGNCRWATKTENLRNRRSSHVIEFNQESHCISEWAEILGLSAKVILARLRLGWTAERALSTPVRVQRKRQER